MSRGMGEMSKSKWVGRGGDWGTAAHWSNGVPDSASVTAKLSGAKHFTVTIGAGGSFTVGGVSISDPAATLALAGTLTLSGDLSLGAATLDLKTGGELVGGTIVTGTGVVLADGGTLDGCTVVGPLNLGGARPDLLIAGGLKIGAADGGAGQIGLGSHGGTIVFEGSQAFNNATISSEAGYANTIQANGTLTLGAKAQISVASSRATISGVDIVNTGTIGASGSEAGISLKVDTFVNKGAINVAGYFSNVYVGGATFTNHGQIDVSGSGSHFNSYAGEFLNAADGSMTVASGGTIAMGDYVKGLINDRFNNAGTIKVDTGATLIMNGNFNSRQIGTVVNHGVVQLKGNIDNSQETLTLGAGGLGGDVFLYATIQGGTVVNNSASLDLQGALDNVDWRGTLDLLSYANLAIVNGGTFTGSNGTGPGTILVEGELSSLILAGNETIDNATIYLGSSSKYGLFNDSILIAATKAATPTTVTLGVDLRIDANVAGSKSLIFPNEYNGLITIVNDGTIEAGAQDGQLQVTVGAFVNHGDIAVSNGDYANFQFVSKFTNTGTITVTGGSSFSFNGSVKSGNIDVAAGSSIGIDGAFTLASLGGIQNHGTVIIGGTLNNIGRTITMGTGPLFGGELTVFQSGGSLDANGSIHGGTLVLGGGAVEWAGGGLNGVQVQGTLDLSSAGEGVSLSGVTLTGAGGVGPGAINLTGANATLDFDGKQSLDNATITVGNSGGTNGIVLVSSVSQTVTLGAGVTIDASVTGSQVIIRYLNFVSTVDLVDNGVINAGASGGSLFMQVPTFTNNGVLAISNGDAVSINGTVNGTGTISLSDASLSLGVVAAGQTLTFGDGAGSLTLSNASGFGGTIAGLQAGDRIDLTFVKATSLTLSGTDQLIVMNGATTVATLQLEGTYQASQFKLTGDKAGGSLITVHAAAMTQAMASLGAGENPGQSPTADPASRITPVLFHGG